MFNTNEVAARTGHYTFNILKYAKNGILPTAKLDMTGRKILGRWVYTDEDIRFLSALKFYRSQRYEFDRAVEKARTSLAE
jgi:DNA-binding transcriptional MerR regulator